MNGLFRNERFGADYRALSAEVHCYALTRCGGAVSRGAVLRLWQEDADFRSRFLGILADSPFSAYRWETPPVTRGTAARPFEFALIDAPDLARKPDASAFAAYFDAAGGDGISVFENLGKDATLVVPAPVAGEAAYGGLAAFVRSAPEQQRHALWRTVGRTVEEKLGDRPLWLSTAGGGVAWLHVRLDSHPKYYSHAAYRDPAWPMSAV